ncbi:MAG TPA: hypothetical protein VG742_19995 [Dongiaceae bacterium]|nr:hypothetical protein [Dongiaceae bacterium]
MIPDLLMIERARQQAESSAALVREQLLLIAHLRADGQPSGKAENFLHVLRRVQSALHEDLAFLQRNLGGAQG